MFLLFCLLYIIRNIFVTDYLIIFVNTLQYGHGADPQPDIQGEWSSAGTLSRDEHQLPPSHPNGGRLLLNL